MVLLLLTPRYNKEMSKIKITQPPIYSVVTADDGSKVGTYTVEINGEQFSTTFKSKTEGAMFAGLKKKYAKALKNSKYGESLRDSDIDNVLGNPKKMRPDQVNQRQSTNNPAPAQGGSSSTTSQTSRTKSLLAASTAPEEEPKMIRVSPGITYHGKLALKR